jgi:hypothetical protein
MKILKKTEDDVQIHPSQQEVFTAESHPPPSAQYTRVIQGTTKYKIKKYKEGDIVWMWDSSFLLQFTLMIALFFSIYIYIYIYIYICWGGITTPIGY